MPFQFVRILTTQSLCLTINVDDIVMIGYNSIRLSTGETIYVNLRCLSLLKAVLAETILDLVADDMEEALAPASLGHVN